MYFNEIFNLNLESELVVLSSCESGVGKIIKGEGAMAMTRGFLYAGVSNIIYTLWKVNDKEASILMLHFYDGILSGKSYAEAMRTAKLQMIRNPETASPNYWGSYLMIGK